MYPFELQERDQDRLFGMSPAERKEYLVAQGEVFKYILKLLRPQQLILRPFMDSIQQVLKPLFIVQLFISLLKLCNLLRIPPFGFGLSCDYL